MSRAGFLRRWFGRKAHPTPTFGPREWFVVKPSMGRKPGGLIPRDVCEALGVDTSPLDHGATIWFTKEQSEAMHKHPEWEPADA